MIYFLVISNYQLECLLKNAMDTTCISCHYNQSHSYFTMKSFLTPANKFGLTVMLLLFLYMHHFEPVFKSKQRLDISATGVIYHLNQSTLAQPDARLQQALKINTIKVLELSFYYSEVSYSQLKLFFTEPFLSYETVKLNLSGANITLESIEYLLSLLPNSIKSIDFDFDAIPLNDAIGKMIASKLNNLTALKYLRLSMVLGLTNKAAEDFFQLHHPNPDIESLELVFIGNSLQNTAVSSTPQYLAPLTKLKSLSLNFYSNKLGFKGAEYIASAVKSLAAPQLHTFEIDLYFNNLMENGTIALCKAIPILKAVTNLTINLDFNYISNDGGKAVARLLTQMPQLTSLHVGVASKNFGYLGFKNVLDGLGTLKNLKHLNFRCGINRVGYNGAEKTRQVIEKMVNLETLTLSFVENYVGDQGMVQLAEAILPLRKLHTLDLNLAFEDARGFGPLQTLKTLLKRVTHHELDGQASNSTALKKLDLSFSHNEITDTQLSLYTPYINSLIKQVDEFEFHFMDTAISRSGLNSLQELFHNARTKKGRKAYVYGNSIIQSDKKKGLDPELERVEAQYQRKKDQQKKRQKQAEEKEKIRLERLAEAKAKKGGQNTKETQENKKKIEEEKQKKELQEKLKRQAQQKQKQEAQQKQKQEAQQNQRKEAQQNQRKEAQQNQRKEAQQNQRKEAQQNQRKEAQQNQRKEAQQNQRKEAQQNQRKEAQQNQRKEAQQNQRKEAQQNQRKEAQQEARIAAQSAKSATQGQDPSSNSVPPPEAVETA